ncbi:MAG: hypothetical protein LUG14_10130 [Synergistaceae bacterium]|nr:hypothetical protein [Synergistaceae bacterium]
MAAERQNQASYPIFIQWDTSIIIEGNGGLGALFREGFISAGGLIRDDGSSAVVAGCGKVILKDITLSDFAGVITGQGIRCSDTHITHDSIYTPYKSVQGRSTLELDAVRSDLGAVKIISFDHIALKNASQVSLSDIKDDTVAVDIPAGCELTLSGAVSIGGITGGGKVYLSGDASSLKVGGSSSIPVILKNGAKLGGVSGNIDVINENGAIVINRPGKFYNVKMAVIDGTDLNGLFVYGGNASADVVSTDVTLNFSNSGSIVKGSFYGGGDGRSTKSGSKLSATGALKSPSASTAPSDVRLFGGSENSSINAASLLVVSLDKTASGNIFLYGGSCARNADVTDNGTELRVLNTGEAAVTKLAGAHVENTTARYDTPVVYTNLGATKIVYDNEATAANSSNLMAAGVFVHNPNTHVNLSGDIVLEMKNGKLGLGFYGAVFDNNLNERSTHIIGGRTVVRMTGG